MTEQRWHGALWIAVPLSTLVLTFMPVLGMRPMIWVIAFWFLVLVLRAGFDPVPISRRQLRWTLFLALPFLLMLIDMFRAPDLVSGWKYAERSSSLLLFPLGFLLLGAPATARFRGTMMDVFSMSAMLLAFGANIGVAFTGVSPALEAEPGYVYNYRAMFGLVTGMHPPYAAYYFFLGAFFQLLRSLDSATYRNARRIATVLLFIAGVLLASRMPLVAFLAAVSVIALLRIPRQKALRTVLGAFGAVLLTIVLSPGMRQRMSEALHGQVAPASQSEVTSTNIRLPLALCAKETIAEHWLLGTGQSDAQATLDRCYRQFNIPLLLDGSYGTHNQILHWWLCFGVIGPLLFAIWFGVLLRHAWRQRDTAHLAFLVFLLLCMLTENVLARQWGVVLFACFNALFVAGTLADQVPGRGLRA